MHNTSLIRKLISPYIVLILVSIALWLAGLQGCDNKKEPVKEKPVSPKAQVPKKPDTEELAFQRAKGVMSVVRQASWTPGMNSDTASK